MGLIILYILSTLTINSFCVPPRPFNINNFNSIEIFSFNFTNNESTNTTDILFVLDTSDLISKKLLSSNCYDLMFFQIDSDDDSLIQLNYFYEIPCDKKDTSIWIRINDLEPYSIDNKFLIAYGNESYESGNGNGNGVIDWNSYFITPTKNFCDQVNGWFNTNEMIGKYPKGSTSFGIMSDKDPHTHDVDSITDDVSPLGHWTNCLDSNCHTPIKSSHHHTIAGTIGHTSVDFEPPYKNVVFCQNEVLNLNEDMMVMFDVDEGNIPAGWQINEEMVDRYSKGYTTYAVEGGSEIHNHNDQLSLTCSGANVVGSNTWAINSKPHVMAHAHDLDGIFSFNSSSLLPYVSVVFATPDLSSTVELDGIILIVKSLPPVGYENFTPLIGKFARGSRTYVEDNYVPLSHNHYFEGQTAPYSSTGVTMNSANTPNALLPHFHTYSFNSSSFDTYKLVDSIEVIYAKRKTPIPITLLNKYYFGNDGDGLEKSFKEKFIEFMTNNWKYFLIGGIVLLVGLLLLCVFIGLITCFCCKKYKVYRKDEDFDILLEEHKLEKKDSGEKARLNINKKMFEVDYADIMLKKEIAKGGSESVVYLATWQEKDVVFKVFRTKDISDQNEFDEFEREVSIAITLCHPNIVQCFGCCLRIPRVNIFMNLNFTMYKDWYFVRILSNWSEFYNFVYICLGDLESYLNNSERPLMSIGDKVRVLTEICSAMSYLHSRNIIHRDLKTQNVLLTESISAKLIDFGLSKIMKEKMKHTKYVGTPVFMAPEIISTSDYDLKADIFSFSIVIYQVLHEVKCTEIYEDNEGLTTKIASDPLYRPVVKNNYKTGTYGWLYDLMKRNWSFDKNDRMSFKQIFDVLKRKNG